MYLYFNNENQTLYLRSIEYNFCRVMNELTKIAEDHGAIIKPACGGYVVNRSIYEKIEECENRIKALEETTPENIKDSARVEKAIKAAIENYKAEIEKLRSIKNDPVKVDRSYIQFVLDNTYYYFSFPDNPFDNSYFVKTPVIDGGKIIKDCYSCDDPKEWFFDSMWRIDCSRDDIKEAANIIFNMLMNSDYSKKYRDGRKTRVHNIYNDGYHYETVYRPERFESLTWLTAEK